MLTDAPCALVAQLVEHLICNQGVAGSNPAGGTIEIKHLALPISQIMLHRVANQFP
jgi:hypothetical protein